jgi:hypothetical protein
MTSTVSPWWSSSLKWWSSSLNMIDKTRRQGARLVGTYDSRVGYGRDGIQVVWSHLIFPDGSSINLEGMAGQDAIGHACLRHDVDNHYKRLVGFGLLTGACRWRRKRVPLWRGERSHPGGYALPLRSRAKGRLLIRCFGLRRPVGLAFDLEDDGALHQPIEERHGQRTVGEIFSPLVKVDVGNQRRGALLVS